MNFCTNNPILKNKIWGGGGQRVGAGGTGEPE